MGTNQPPVDLFQHFTFTMRMFNLPPEAPFGGKPSWTRHIIVTIFGEFCGTFLFLFLSFAGAQTALDTNDPLDPEAPLLPYSLMYISASFGVSLALTVWVFFRVTGGMFNPAVTWALILARVVKPIAGLAIIVTQLVAAIAASAVVSGILPGPFAVGNKLNNGTSIAQGLFLEMFITTPLVLAVLFLAVEKHHGTYLAPVAQLSSPASQDTTRSSGWAHYSGQPSPLWCMRYSNGAAMSTSTRGKML